MSSTQHLHGNGAGSSSEKINALERQVKDLRSENECIASYNESLRAKSTAHSAEETSSPGTAVCEDPDHLSQELNRVNYIALELGLRLREPNKPNELSILCSVICHRGKLANLKSFLRDHSGVPDMTGGSICLEQTGFSCVGMSLAIIGKNRTRCLEHDDNNYDCVWISKRGSGWIIGSGRF